MTMRIPSYLSPSSIMTWNKDRVEFYRKYLCSVCYPRMAQTEPMSVGSAFDAYVKAYIAKGLGIVCSELQLDYLLDTQVEEHNRAFAIPAGEHCFNEYKRLGALSELMKELEQAASEPCFEYTIEARVGNEVPLLGKPDLYFYTKDGALVIIDWKVNGYCSKRPVSPKKGHLRLLSDKGDALIITSHKDAHSMRISGLDVNVACNMEDLDLTWATQLAIYGWVLGGVGRQVIAGIDQLACKPMDGRPSIRVAQLRNKISSTFQDTLWVECREIWNRINTGNIFDTNNDETIAQLEAEVAAYVDDGSVSEDWFTKIQRSY